MRSVLLATLAGVLYFLGFAGFGIWPLVFVFQAVLLLAIEGQTPVRALGLGALAGFVANCGGYYWVIHLLQTFAHLPLPLALLGYALLNLYQGALWGVVAWLVARARRDLGMHPGWVLPVAVVATEWIYPLLFPSYVAASLFETPWLTQIADLGGPLLVEALIAGVNGAIYAVVAWTRFEPGRRALRLPMVVGAAVVATLVYGVVRVVQIDAQVASARTLRVALIQSNLGEENKVKHRREFLVRHQQMSRAAIAAHPDVELVVWPESAFNYAVPRSQPRVGRELTRGVSRPVLSGAITFSGRGEDREVYNSAVLTSSTGDIRAIFDKVNLLYFGETIPLVETFPAIETYFPNSSRFTRGRSLRHLELEDGTALLPMICYEDLIPSFVRDMWVAAGPPDALVNVTNDSWYGNTHEPRIHLALATLRSIETRRSLIRSTNTGISAIVDPVGRITHRTGQWTQEVLVADVPLIEDESATVYVYLGDWPGWVAALVILAGGLTSWRRARRRR